MKKLFLLIGVVMMSLSAMAITTEEVVGKWESNNITAPTPDPSMKASSKIALDLKSDLKASVKQEQQITLGDTKVTIDMFITVEGDGTYTTAGDSITITLDPATIKLKFTEDDVRITGIDDVSQQQEIVSQMVQGMSQNAEAMKQELAKPFTINDVMITGKKMMCKLEDILVSFKKKK